MGFYFLYRKRAIAKLISEKEIASFSEFSEYNRLDEAQKQYAAHIVSLREGLGLKEVRVRVTKNRIRYYYDIDDMMKDQANQRAIVNPDLVYKYEDDMIDIQEGDLELINEYFDEELIKQIITEAKSEGKSRILCPICKSTVKSKNFLKHYRKTHENMNERVDFVPF